MASPVKIAGTFSAEMYGFDEILVRPAHCVVHRDRLRTAAGQQQPIILVKRVGHGRCAARLRREHRRDTQT